MPNNIYYFQRILDNMCPVRSVSKRSEKHKTIYFYFDNIADIYNFYRKIQKIMLNPNIKIINKQGKNIYI